MAKRTIGKPRFYADLGSYLKLKSYYASDKDGIETDNVDSVWNLDPSASQTFEINSESSKATFWQRFADEDNNTELKRLLFDSVHILRVISFFFQFFYPFHSFLQMYIFYNNHQPLKYSPFA